MRYSNPERSRRPRSSTFAAALLGAAAAWLTAGAAEAQVADPPNREDAAARVAAADTAVFAGGCFWCMEPPYEELEGVRSVRSGYAGGQVANPSYEQVSRGGTGHREVVQVIYEPARVEYERLLEIYWRHVDPLDAGGQFCDRGHQYTSAIYTNSPEQERSARASRSEVKARFDEPVVTPIEHGATFYPAEEEHQDYYQKHSIRYRFYKWSCGREDRLDEVWGEIAAES